MARGVKKIAFTIATNQAASGILDMTADGYILVGISIHNQWTAAKIGFLAYVPGSSASGIEDPQWDPTTSAWIGGPFDSTAEFDVVKDQAGTPIQYGNGTDTLNQYLMIVDNLRWYGARWIKVNASQPQAQTVTGYLLVRDP